MGGTRRVDKVGKAFLDRGSPWTDFDFRFSVLIKMFATTISVLSSHLGPSNR